MFFRFVQISRLSSFLFNFFWLVNDYWMLLLLFAYEHVVMIFYFPLLLWKKNKTYMLHASLFHSFIHSFTIHFNASICMKWNNNNHYVLLLSAISISKLKKTILKWVGVLFGKWKKLLCNICFIWFCLWVVVGWKLILRHHISSYISPWHC